MPRRSVAWSITGDDLTTRLAHSTVDLEKHLENWVEKDVDIVDDGLLVIGRQVTTDFGTKIDVLAIDAAGDMVIIELKRDQTLRETVAQGLEYAAWISDLNVDRVTRIAADHFGGQELFEEAYERRFDHELPDSLNERQRIVLVAPVITEQSAKTIEYLSAQFSLPINGVSFDLFDVGGQRVLVRQVVIEEEPSAPSARQKRRPSRTMEELLELADANGVGAAARHLAELADALGSPHPAVQAWSFRRTRPDGKAVSVMLVYPTADWGKGTLDLYLSPGGIAATSGAPPSDAESLVEKAMAIGNPAKTTWTGWNRFRITTLEQATQLSQLLRSWLAAREGGQQP